MGRRRKNRHTDYSLIVMKYKGRMTLRKFADILSENVGMPLTHATIINWRDGNTEPETDFLLWLVKYYGDWRREFALDCLKVKHPEIADILEGDGNGR